MKFKYYLIYRLIKILPRLFINLFSSLYRQKLNDALNFLIKKKVNINNVYDIGAYRGNWSNFLKKTSLNKSNFFLFEANIENQKFLKELGFKYFISVLSDKKKEVEFYSKNLTGDSYYIENTNLYEKDLDKKITKTNTLNDIVEKNNIPLPDFIKVDTQGSEIDILKGGDKILSNCSLIYIECPIIQYNQNSPNFVDYINYMKSIDFLPYEICEVHYIDKVMVQIDILFLKISILNEINQNKKILNILNLANK